MLSYAGHMLQIFSSENFLLWLLHHGRLGRIQPSQKFTLEKINTARAHKNGRLEKSVQLRKI